MAVYQEAKRQWGERSQIVAALEELAECSVVLAKYLNGKHQDLDTIYTELADAEIMLEQMRIYFSGAKIDEFKDFKLRRLSKRLGLHEECGAV
jgi:hypothetical protein